MTDRSASLLVPNHQTTLTRGETIPPLSTRTILDDKVPGVQPVHLCRRPVGPEAFALTAPRRPVSFGRPLGQCCRYCRQHCTGLALRTPDRLSAASVKHGRLVQDLERLISVYELRARRATQSTIGHAQLHACARTHEVAKQRLEREAIQSSAANIDDPRALCAKEDCRIIRARPAANPLRER